MNNPQLRLQVDKLRGGYHKLEIVHGVSFAIEAGDVLCLLGPNGCGKSTLLKLLLRFLPKMDGKVYCREEDLDTMDRKRLAQVFSYIPQTDRMSFPYTVLEMVTMARTSHLGAWATPKKEDADIARASLEKFKIGHLADHLYNTLSGGQRQLVLIARALCQSTCVLVMDEPTASLDFANQQLITEAIRLLAGEGKIVVMTTHSPSQPFAVASKVLLLEKGHSAGFGPPEQILTDQSLERVFGLPMQVVSVYDRNQNQHRICLSI